MRIKINEDNPDNGLLGLVIAVVEVIVDTLKLQAVRRMDSGKLSGEEIERLGAALMKLDETIEKIKEGNGITGAVENIKNGLDDVVNSLALEETEAVENGWRSA